MVEYTIDRFEGEYAICENRETEELTNISITKIPKGAKEGDILDFSNGEYTINHEEAKVTREEIQELMEELKKK